MLNQKPNSVIRDGQVILTRREDLRPVRHLLVVDQMSKTVQRATTKPKQHARCPASEVPCSTSVFGLSVWRVRKWSLVLVPTRRHRSGCAHVGGFPHAVFPQLLLPCGRGGVPRRSLAP